MRSCEEFGTRNDALAFIDALHKDADAELCFYKEDGIEVWLVYYTPPTY